MEKYEVEIPEGYKVCSLCRYSNEILINLMPKTKSLIDYCNEFIRLHNDLVYLKKVNFHWTKKIENDKDKQIFLKSILREQARDILRLIVDDINKKENKNFLNNCFDNGMADFSSMEISDFLMENYKPLLDRIYL